MADLLGRVPDLTVECTGPLHCLTVTSHDLNQARCVHRLVTLSDPMAVLVNVTYGLPSPALAATEGPATATGTTPVHRGADL